MEEKKWSFDEFSNLYEVRRTVRFELVPQFKNPPKPEKLKNVNNEVNVFIDSYEKIISNFGKIVFKSYNIDELNTKLKLKFSWLKTYTKQEYYENNVEKYKKNINQVEITKPELKYLFERFQNWIETNKGLLDRIKELSGKSDENKSRKSDLAYYFHQITKRSNIEFIKELFNNNIQDTKWDDLINKTKDLTIKITTLLEWIEKTLLPSQSMWQVIEKASFNYYTVNKKPKNYEENIKNLKNDFNKTLFDFKDYKTNWFKFDNKEKWFQLLIESLEDNNFWLTKYWNIEKFEKNFLSLKIENAYNLMKLYKSEQKSAFLEFLSDWKTFEDLTNHIEFKYGKTKEEVKYIKIYLFDDIAEVKFGNIVKVTKEIQSLSTEYNQNKSKDLKEKITELKKTRWEYFNERNKSIFAFTKYGNFCSEYKKIAMEFGKIKANIKSLEKEKVDAEKTNSWALMLEKDNQKYLLTIPRTTHEKLDWWESNLNKAKTFIDNLKEEDWFLKLIKFESLTLRALDKLCFGKENNTFRWNIFSEISQKYPKFLNDKSKLKDKFEFKKNREDKEIDEKLLLEFYQIVLTLESTKKQIIVNSFVDFDEFIKQDYLNLEEFETELKKTCYIKENINISETTKDNLVNNFNTRLYKITSYDLQKNDKEVLDKLVNKKELSRKNPEDITKLWYEFWSNENQNNKYPIRLNPEIKISYIEKDIKFIENNEWNIFKNRKFNDRYLLTSTITQNALNKSLNLNFKTKNEIIDSYQNYNNDFNETIKEKGINYFYWLDRWENELVSLGLFDLSKEITKQKWLSIDVWELKKEYFLKELNNETKTSAYKNLSYFLEDEEIFDKKTITSCFDLTSSKLINWKIILNWDISSYLKLKEISAKRKIYDLISTWNNKSFNINIIDNRKIVIEWNEWRNDILYYYDNRYDNLITTKEIKEKLEKYLVKVKADLSDNEAISIEKVNNLRDAICANMVWIISHLQTIYPWMIFLEDFNIAKKNDDFNKNNTTLWSRIELKLLQKFSSLNIVPPNYKQTMSLQGEKSINQLWIIGYINKDNTSNLCPCCPWKLFWHWTYEFEDKMCHNEQNKHWIMSNWDVCNYHMELNPMEFSFIKSWDALASYNIAKRWLEFVNNL